MEEIIREETISIPQELMIMMGWDENTELKVTIDGNSLILEEDTDDDS